MIGTLLQIAWLSLVRDRLAFLLTFVVPIVFFSVQSLFFLGSGTVPRVRVALVDEDDSELSRRLAAGLEREESLRVWHDRQWEGTPRGTELPLVGREQAAALVKNGEVAAAVVLPAGLGETLGRFEHERKPVLVIADTSDPVAPQMIGGLLQKVAMLATPEVIVERGVGRFEQWGVPLTGDQRRAIDDGLARMRQADSKPETPGGPGASQFGLVPVEVVDLLGQKKLNPMVAFYAAASAVLFLLFGCANTAGGALLAEADNGTLERLLVSDLGMGQLLVGKWLASALMGLVQVTTMFIWGAIFFGVALWNHLPGFFLMATATAAAGAAFGLVLGTACRTRSQLGGVSSIVVLLLSAIGGSMYPRVLMNETLQKVGLLAFNAWALDGFTKLFWRDASVWELRPQLAVLAVTTIVCLTAARVLARRWRTA